MNAIFRSIIAMVMAFSVVACNKDNTPNGDEQNSGDVFVSFGVNIPAASSLRAETEVGTEAENKISKVLVVLYNATTNDVDYNFSFDIKYSGKSGENFAGNDISNATSATSSRFVTVAQMVKKQDYKIAVFLNPTARIIEATQKGRRATELDAVLGKDDLLHNDGHIQMTNEQGLVSISSSALKPSVTEAEAAPVRVTVDRVVAKVVVNGEGVVAKTAGDAVSDLEWTLDVTNKKSFLMRKFAPLGGTLTMEAQGDNSDRAMRYATDPNFDGNYDTMSSTDLAAEFDYITVPTSLVTANATTAMYVLENTMAKEKQYTVATTQVFLKLVYTPSGLQKGKTWVLYRGKKMHLDDFNTKIQEAKNPGATDASLDMPTGFIDEMKTKSAYPDEALKEPHLSIFKDGVCHYRIPIRHFGDNVSPDKMSYGRYGLVRNNVYTVNIKSVSIPGEPKNTPPDPNTPDDKKDTYISFNISVNYWYIRTQNISL